MTSSNMVLRKTASYFRLVIRGHGDSHFQIGQLRQRKTRERGIPFYRRNLISFVCISRAAAPFLPATDADLQRFYKEYFVDSDSEDDGILFKRRMFVRGQFI